MKTLKEEIAVIAGTHRFVPKTKWTPYHMDVLKKYGGKVSNKGLLKIFQKMFPKDYFTYHSVAKMVSRRRKHG